MKKFSYILALFLLFYVFILNFSLGAEDICSNPGAFKDLIPISSALKLTEYFQKEGGEAMKAFKKTMKFFRENANGIKNKKAVPRKITNKDYITIIDYSKPSTEPRMYLLSLKTGKVEKFYVAHGRGSGQVSVKTFSNANRLSNMSPRGFHLTDLKFYHGKKHKNAVRMHGLEAINSNSYARCIEFHEVDNKPKDWADESSIEINRQSGLARLGLSYGCPVLSRKYYPNFRECIVGGSLVYIHADTKKSRDAIKIGEKVILDGNGKPVVDDNGNPKKKNIYRYETISN